MSDGVRDPVNQPIVSIRDQHGISRLGLHANKQWFEDPRHLAFSLARYKFVAKMLSGADRVLEVGCGDGFAARVVQQEVRDLTLTDIDPLFVADAAARTTPEWPVKAQAHDMVQGRFPGEYDAIYTLDVLEHVAAADETKFLDNLTASLKPHGVCIVGMPSLESQTYSKPASVTGHINCKTAPDLKSLMGRYFHNVFMFSMNDEVVHTGYHKMAQYILAICCSPKA